MGNGEDEGDEGDEGERSNAQCPMPNAQCPIPNQYSSDKTKTLVETAIYRVSKTHNFVQLALN